MRAHSGHAGFTLLEMMIALVVMMLIGGLAMPRLGQFVDRLAFSMRRASVERQLTHLGRHAVDEGRDLDLETWPPAQIDVYGNPTSSTTEQLIDLPNGWRLVVNGSIHYRFDGVCSGGTLSVIIGQSSYAYTLAAPLCHPVLS
ncbi:MAG: type II secretion system protein [Acidobacteriaceae bacterium]|nr:type II secretion system protein [Acidobacteriaceae bacterium]